MMRLTVLLCSLLFWLGGAFSLHAQPTFGVGDYVENATTILRVQAEGPGCPGGETLSPPAPPDQRRVWVKEVLKGVDTVQEFLVAAPLLAPGQEAVVLFPYEHPVRGGVAVKQKRDNPLPPPRVWPVDPATGKLNTGSITARPDSTWTFDPKVVNFVDESLVRDAIAQQSPEQVGLQARVLDAAFFPERSGTSVKQGDIQEADFARFAAVVYHVEHEVLALANLLESRDLALRAAATKKLEALAGEAMPDRAAGAEAIRDWIKLLPGRLPPRPVDRWPAVPADLQLPPDDFPPALLASLEKADAAAFAREFEPWMNSGVRRDRSVHTVNSGLFTGGRTALLLAPRLQPEWLFDTSVPAKERMAHIAGFALTLHFDRLARERAASADLISNQGDRRAEYSPVRGPSMRAMNAKMFPTKGGADLETLRRAAFWEITGVFDEFAAADTGQNALNRLAERDGEETQRFLLALFMEHRGRGTDEAALIEIRLGHQPFLRELEAYMSSHRDGASKRIDSLFDQTDQPLTAAYYLGWLKDTAADARSRWEIALRLCQHPYLNSEVTSDILTIFESETDAKVKKQLFIALAQTGDPRVLDLLLMELPAASEWQERLEIVRGLGRVRDKKVLPVLADLAGGQPEISSVSPRDEAGRAAADLRREAAQMFGWVARYKDVWPPTEFNAGLGIENGRVERDFRRVKAYREKGEVVADMD